MLMLCHAGVEPNVVTYTTIMGVLHRSGQWQMAMHIFRKMEGAGIQADVKAYNAAIAACAKGCDWQQAWSVFAGLCQPACSQMPVRLTSCQERTLMCVYLAGHGVLYMRPCALAVHGSTGA